MVLFPEDIESGYLLWVSCMGMAKYALFKSLSREV